MTKQVAALLTGMFVTSFAAAQEDLWMQDFAAAKAKAKAEHKQLLLDFTGSDWCIWCKRLDEEVFSTDAFKTEAPKTFVLVKLDFPRDASLVTDEVRAQNEKLQTEFAIEGFPTIVLTDPDGRPFATTGYQPGGPDKYLPHLQELAKQKQTFDDAMAKARQLQGAERAKALHEALSALQEPIALQYYQKEIDELLQLDADGKAGVRKDWDSKLADQKVKQQIQDLQQEINKFATAGEWDKLIARVEDLAKTEGTPKGLKQHALFYKGLAIMESKTDADAAAVELKKAKAIDPESELGQQIDMIIEKMQQAAKQKKGGGKDEKGKEEGGGKEEKGGK